MRRARRATALERARARRRGRSSPTTAPRTAAPSSPRAAGARVVARAAPRLRQRLPRRLRRRARATTSSWPTPTSPTTSTRSRASSSELDDGAELVMGDRMDNIQPGRDAVAAPLRRQPDPHRHPQPLLPHRRQRRPLRHARAAPRRAAARSTCARPAWSSPPRWSSAPPRRTSTIREFPIEYHPRGGESKLSSFRDGWRHLRFLLVHSPTHLFIDPRRW